jgi:diacylglycerol kinase (ATP)
MTDPSEIAAAPRIHVAEAPYRTALVVANPVSGRGLGAKAAHELRDGLQSLGVDARVHLTTGRGDALRTLRAAGADLDLAVAVGGDGTLREVLEGLVDPETAVGLLPFGTAKLAALDVASVDGRMSFLALGVGLDGSIVRTVEERRTGPITKWSYVTAAARTLVRYSPPRLTVELDGEAQPGEYGLVLVCNTRGYGGLLHLDPESRLDDGRFEVYLFPTGRLTELVSALARGVLKSLPGGPVRMQRARRVRVDSPEPIPYQVDGDAGGVTPVELEIRPNQYHLVVP